MNNILIAFDMLIIWTKYFAERSFNLLSENSTGLMIFLSTCSLLSSKLFQDFIRVPFFKRSTQLFEAYYKLKKTCKKDQICVVCLDSKLWFTYSEYSCYLACAKKTPYHLVKYWKRYPLQCLYLAILLWFICSYRF